MYGNWIRSACAVVDADVDDLGVEDLADLVADEVVHRLHVEVGGEALLDAVDDRQLGRPLVGLGQEARVSSNSRAFSRATPRLEASVLSRRSSASSKASTEGFRADQADGPGPRPRSARRATTRSLIPKAIPPSAEASASVPIRSACLVSITFELRPRPSSMDSDWMRRPSSISYGNADHAGRDVRIPMKIDVASKISRILLPTRSYDRLHVELGGEAAPARC